MNDIVDFWAVDNLKMTVIPLSVFDDILIQMFDKCQLFLLSTRLSGRVSAILFHRYQRGNPWNRGDS